jgi:hypothetical protein
MNIAPFLAKELTGIVEEAAAKAIAELINGGFEGLAKMKYGGKMADQELLDWQFARAKALEETKK